MSNKKLLAIASGGGHWMQLRRLHPAFDGLEVVFASVQSTYADDVPHHRFYRIRNVTRWDRWNLIVAVVQLVGILLKERPRTVITTGAGPGMIALALAKVLLGSKTIWIDSIANCEELSGAGWQARHFADVWLTQWPQLAQAGGPEYWGAVL